MVNRQTAEAMSDDEESTEPMDPRGLLEEILLAIVDNKDKISVVEQSDKDAPDTKVLYVEVAPTDRGKVIGQNGVIAQSLRFLFNLIGQQSGQAIEVRINGGNNWKPRPQREQGFHFGNQQPQPQMMVVQVPAGFVSQQGFQGRQNFQGRQGFQGRPGFQGQGPGNRRQRRFNDAG